MKYFIANFISNRKSNLAWRIEIIIFKKFNCQISIKLFLLNLVKRLYLFFYFNNRYKFISNQFLFILFFIINIIIILCLQRLNFSVKLLFNQLFVLNIFKFNIFNILTIPFIWNWKIGFTKFFMIENFRGIQFDDLREMLHMIRETFLAN